MFVMYRDGLIDARSAWLAGGLVAAADVVMLTGLAAGAATRYSRGTLTLIQTFVASSILLFGATLATPHGRTLLTLLVPLPFVFAAFDFGRVRLLWMATALIAMHAVWNLASPLWTGRPLDTSGLWSLTLALAVELISIALIAGRITEIRYRYRQKLESSHEALMHLTDAIFALDDRLRVDFANPAATRLLAAHVRVASGVPVESLFPGVDASTVREHLEHWLSEQGKDPRANHTTTLRVPVQHAATGRREFELTAVAQPDRRRSGGAFLVVRDVTESERHLSDLRTAAMTDPVTGLYNRRGLQEYFEASLAASPPQAVGVLALDLDQFKLINDTCGHQAGDEMLRMVGEVLLATLPPQACCARLGGDEFAAAVADLPLAALEELGAQLVERIDDLRLMRDGRQFRVGASVGISRSEADLPLADLLSRADVACLAAKKGGGRRVAVYTPSADDASRHRQDLNWAARIQDALNRRRFVLLGQRLQPVHVTAGPGIEALLRMQDDDDTLLEPDLFLPSAERFGLMPALDRHAFLLAVEAMAASGARGASHGYVAINLSSGSLADPGLLEFIARTAQASKVEMSRFMFEISESASLADPLRTRNFLDGVQRLGARTSLAGLAVAHDAISHVRSLPLDQLKIDASVVATSEHDAVTEQVLRAHRAIAAASGAAMVVEKVESAAQLAAATRLGADLVQGMEVQRLRRLEELLD